jgi:hypothetical protein
MSAAWLYNNGFFRAIATLLLRSYMCVWYSSRKAALVTTSNRDRMAFSVFAKRIGLLKRGCLRQGRLAVDGLDACHFVGVAMAISNWRW